MLKVGLIGNLGGDPELQYAASGAPFLRFNVEEVGPVEMGR